MIGKQIFFCKNASKFPVFINYKSDDLQIILYTLQIIKNYILRDTIKGKHEEKM